MQLQEMMSLVEQDARIEGLEKGRAEGLAEGRAEGLAEGRAYARYEAVDKLVADGVYDVVRACEVLGVDLAAYNGYLAERSD